MRQVFMSAHLYGWSHYLSGEPSFIRSSTNLFVTKTRSLLIYKSTKQSVLPFISDLHRSLVLSPLFIHLSLTPYIFSRSSLCLTFPVLPHSLSLSLLHIISLIFHDFFISTSAHYFWRLFFPSHFFLSLSHPPEVSFFFLPSSLNMYFYYFYSLYL